MFFSANFLISGGRSHENVIKSSLKIQHIVINYYFVKSLGKFGFSEVHSLVATNSYLCSHLGPNSSSWFASSIQVSKRSPKEVQFWISFGILFHSIKSLLNWECKPKLRRQIEDTNFTFISRPIENANRSLLPIENANRSLLWLMNAPQMSYMEAP